MKNIIYLPKAFHKPAIAVANEKGAIKAP